MLLRVWCIVITFPFYLETAGRKSNSSASNKENAEKRDSQPASDTPNGN